LVRFIRKEDVLMTMNRKENDICTLDKIEGRERLNEDCNYIRNIKNNMKSTSQKRLEQERIEFIKNRNSDLSVEEHLIVNEVFEFLKNRV
jgi:hypothetical protein